MVSKKIKSVLAEIDTEIANCEKLYNENIKLERNADKDIKSDYYRAIDYYFTRIKDLKKAKEIIAKEYIK